MAHWVENKTVLVTGAGGFVGPSVVNALVRRGARVRALTGPPGHTTPPFPAGVTTLESDVGDLTRLCEFTAGADLVVHMAGPASVSESYACAAEYARVHIGGTVTVLDACRITGVNRVIYVSSAEVYGQPETNPVREDYPVQARSPYAAAKIGAERFVEAFVHAHEIHAMVLRPFSLYGPRVSPQSLLGTIIHDAGEGVAIVLADLEPVRDYCHVDDMAEAVLCAASATIPSYCVVNVGTGQGTSVAALAAIVLEILGRDLPVRERPGKKRPGNSEITRLIADPTRAREILRWSPSFSLRSGLEQTIRLMRRE